MPERRRSGSAARRARDAAALAAVGAIAACGAPAGDGVDNIQSGAMVASSDRSALYVVSADDDLLVRFRPEDQTVEALDLPGEPTRITRVGDGLLVTLRAKRTLVRVRDEGLGLAVERRIEVGAEPYGVAASPDGRRVYVSESVGGRVLELEAEHLDRLRSWTLAGGPRGLAVHPSGRRLYVSGSAPGTMYAVDVESGDVAHLVAPPAESGGVPMSPRITGDPAVSPDGARVAFPAVFVQNGTPIPRSPGGSTYYDSTGGRRRIVPAVVVFSTDAAGRPTGEAELVRFDVPEYSSYPSSVRFSDDGDVVFATLEGAGVVASAELDEGAVFGVGDGFVYRYLVVSTTAAGPRALAFLGDDVFVFGFLDRAVARLPREAIAARGNAGFFEGPRGVAITDRRRSDDWELGRRLFYSTNDPRVSAAEVDVSCATCHFEGRDDGLTWHFFEGASRTPAPRQTPSLVGKVSEREPVTWTGAVATVADDAFATGQQLMGATRMTDEAARAIARYVDTIRAVDPPLRAADTRAVDRGRRLFERADVGCARCHSGPQRTDNQVHEVRGGARFVTPGLRGVAATPPYFHDGSAKDLRAVLETSDQLGMGRTDHLNEQELDDLEAYLRSL